MKAEQKKKKKGAVNTILAALVMVLIGVVIGFCGGMHMGETLSSHGVLGLLVWLVAVFLAAYFQIALHEGGHLVFGLLTGYRFSSYRIGSFMWIRQDGKLHFRRFSLAGTGGQCLMIPPEMTDGKFPYVLYNLGGSIVNLASTVIFFCLHLLCRNTVWWLADTCMIVAIIGATFALVNGIPMRLGVDNDGRNALSIGKNPQALRAFWLQMKVNEQIAGGVRLKDMPEEWFEMPTDEAMKNSMVATIAVFACNRMMDQMDFSMAQQTMEKLLEADPAGLLPIYRSLLKIDIAYCEMVGENRAEVVEKLWDKEQQQFMKQMATFPSVLRTKYVHSLLVEQNPAATEKIQQQFDKAAKKYPHPHEIATERELMAYAKERVENSYKS